MTKEEENAIRRELKAFDLDVRFGPCVGLQRSMRWDRARNLSLDPPPRIKELLEDCKAKNLPDFDLDLWHHEL